jgi:cytochrome c5
MSGVRYNGSRIRTLDDAISWAHTFTDEASVLQAGGVCENCHKDRTSKISETSGKWLRHSFYGRVGRKIQDKAEIEALGHVAGGQGVENNDPQSIYDTVCTSCHALQGGPDVGFQNLVACDNTTWKNHLIQGRIAQEVWEFVSETEAGSTCGW